MSLAGHARSGAVRIKIGQAWERQVTDVLRELGWRIQPYGQALLSSEARDILKSTNDPQRWTPDLIGQSPTGRTVYVEAKFSDPTDTGNHAVEVAASDAHIAWWDRNAAPIIYAFPSDATNVRVCFMHVVRFKAHARVKPYRGRGSGTPFSVASHGLCEFDPMAAAMYADPADTQASLW